MRENEKSSTAGLPNGENGGTYEFTVKGHLDDRWLDWFGGVTLHHTQDRKTGLDVTEIRATLADQPALHGFLNRIRDLNLTLLSLRRLGPIKLGAQSSPVDTGRPVSANKQRRPDMDKRTWFRIAAGLSFFMAVCQTIISLSPAAASYFQAPPPLLENRWMLFLVGEAAALIVVIFGFYALSGAGIIRRLPLLRLGLIGIGALFLLRGLFVIFSVLVLLGILQGQLLIQGEISTLVFLAAGVAFAVGTALNWKNL